MLHSPHEDSNEPSDAYGDAFGLSGQTAFVARLGNIHLKCDAVCPRQAVFLLAVTCLRSHCSSAH